MSNALKKLIREPLFHFVLLGAAIFMVYSFLPRHVSEQGTIVITKGEIAALQSGFFTTWHRQPTQEELEGLVRQRIKQEVYCREAVALGLDKDDIIIQRRLQQKMEFIVNDNAEEAKPSDSELQDFLAKHPDKFKVEPRFTFKQVFLNPDKRGASIKNDATKILYTLNQPGTDFKKSGDYTLLPAELSNATATEISGQFGNEFALQLAQLPKGKWQGPVQSAYGLHLVQISERTDGGTPALSEVQEAVSREWQSEHSHEANEKYYNELLKNYKVTIEDYKH
jgi:hypothetical protein